MTAYYNEFDPYAAEWLRNLIAAGHIAPGVVDDRSLLDVTPDDVRGFTQCHFFAGIGVWSYALRLAQWPDTRPVWTGSCPCQPFSVAGAGAGVRDERHLWPFWFWLIEQCQPAVIFGEQVEAAIRHGWLDLVQTDLEGIGYAVGAAGIPAAGVGAPHIRQRLWFVADTNSGGLPARGEGREALGYGSTAGADRSAGGVDDDDDDKGLEGYGRGHQTESERKSAVRPTTASGESGYWTDADWLPCRDGKARPVEPGTFPLAHGVAARVGRLRAYGNAIVPQVAAEVIRAYMECRP